MGRCIEDRYVAPTHQESRTRYTCALWFSDSRADGSTNFDWGKCEDKLVYEAPGAAAVLEALERLTKGDADEAIAAASDLIKELQARRRAARAGTAEAGTAEAAPVRDAETEDLSETNRNDGVA